MVNAKSTKEHVRAYADALAEERAGYEARIASAKAGRAERLSSEQLSDRIAQVDAEAKRVKGLLGKKKDDDDA